MEWDSYSHGNMLCLFKGLCRIMEDEETVSLVGTRVHLASPACTRPCHCAPSWAASLQMRSETASQTLFRQRGECSLFSKRFSIPWTFSLEGMRLTFKYALGQINVKMKTFSRFPQWRLSCTWRSSVSPGLHQSLEFDRCGPLSF